MRNLFLGLGLFLAISFAACAAVHHDMRAEVMRQVATGAVTVHVSDGTGSGTIIGRKGKAYLILTCEHVIKGNLTAEVETLSGKFPAFVDKTDPKQDLAILVSYGDLDASIVRVAPEEPRLYDRLYVLSSPLGIQRTGSEGILYSKDEDLSEGYNGRWAFTGFILPGSSGGTVTNAEGDLVCVAEAIKANSVGLRLIPELAYCVGLKDIRTFTTGYMLGK